MTVPTVTLNENTPAGSDDVAAGDNRIREFKTQVREIMDVDHKYDSSGQDADMGKHNKATFIEAADIGTGAEGLPILGAQTADGKAELTFTDEDDNDIQLTKSGVLLLDSGRVTNDTYIKAIDNAGTGTVNLIKADTSDEIVFGVTATLPDTSALATSAAPTADAEISNKKYVDDQIAAISLPAFGAWVDKSAGYGAQQASTDGFLVLIVGDGSVESLAKIYTDGDVDPSTKMAEITISGGDNSSIMCPVRKDDYWKVTKDAGGGNIFQVYWLPLS